MKRAWICLAPLLVAAAFGQTPVIFSGGVVDAANFTAGQAVAPGGLVAIFGSDLAGALTLADTVPLSTQLADVSVTFNSVPAPLLAAIPSGPNNPAQINAQLPWNVLPAGVASGTATVVVSRGTVMSAPIQVNVGAVGPGIFAYPSGIGQAIAVIQTANPSDARYGALAAPAGSIAGINTAPAQVGDFIQIYASGLGAVDSPIANGAISTDKLRRTVAVPTVLIGGVAVSPSFSGLSPYFVGVDQVNVQIPANAPKGNAVTLQLQVGGITTNSQVTIAIQ